MFVSYWVPSRFFLDLNHEMSILKSKDVILRTKEKNISDDVIEGENKLQVTFQDNANLLIHVYGTEYILEFVTIHKIGFFIYKLPENYIEIQAYHIIFKEFFHSHEYHDEEEYVVFVYYSKINLEISEHYIVDKSKCKFSN